MHFSSTNSLMHNVTSYRHNRSVLNNLESVNVSTTWIDRRSTSLWRVHASMRREKVKDKERQGENNRLMSEVECMERRCHWISDVGVKGQVNLGASGMTLQRDDITTVERGNRSRCVCRDVRVLAVVGRNGDVAIDGCLYRLPCKRYRVASIGAMPSLIILRAKISAKEP